jgi:hypothetical protein
MCRDKEDMLVWYLVTVFSMVFRLDLVFIV